MFIADLPLKTGNLVNRNILRIGRCDECFVIKELRQALLHAISFIFPSAVERLHLCEYANMPQDSQKIEGIFVQPRILTTELAGESAHDCIVAAKAHEPYARCLRCTRWIEIWWDLWPLSLFC
jgi:hypothetical protein